MIIFLYITYTAKNENHLINSLGSLRRWIGQSATFARCQLNFRHIHTRRITSIQFPMNDFYLQKFLIQAVSNFPPRIRILSLKMRKAQKNDFPRKATLFSIAIGGILSSRSQQFSYS